MVHLISYLWRYFIFQIEAKSIHGIHSPYVFELLNNTINNKTPYYIFKPIEQYRKFLSVDIREIEVEDYGAGSNYTSSKRKKVSKIANTSLKRAKYAQLLFRLALKRKPKTILELGTSLGITTLYFSYSNSATQIITIEGSKEIARIAEQNFKKFKRNKIDLQIGTFSDKLPDILSGLHELEFAFIDGHHDKIATMAYFKTLLTKKTENSLFIFDDIHWSKGMEEAWKIIQSHEDVSLTIDLFEMGLVFFMKRKQKEHFLIRF